MFSSCLVIILLFLFRCKDTHYFGNMTIWQRFFCKLVATCPQQAGQTTPPRGRGGRGGGLVRGLPPPQRGGGQGGRGKGRELRGMARGGERGDGRTGRREDGQAAAKRGRTGRTEDGQGEARGGEASGSEPQRGRRPHPHSLNEAEGRMPDSPVHGREGEGVRQIHPRNTLRGKGGSHPPTHSVYICKHPVYICTH